MWNGEIINLKAFIPVPSFELETVFKDGDTDDIISTVMKADKETAAIHETAKFAKLFEQKDEYETLRKIYDNVKFNVDYSEDKDGHEIIKMPAALIFFKKGDCKSLSGLIADLVREVHGGKVKTRFRFVSQMYFNPTPHHVYPICTLSDGTEVIMDTVYDWFDREPFYWHHQDFKAAK